jgi:hypothetical protein
MYGSWVRIPAGSLKALAIAPFVFLRLLVFVFEEILGSALCSDVAQMVAHPDFIGRVLGSPESLRDSGITRAVQ